MVTIVLSFSVNAIRYLKSYMRRQCTSYVPWRWCVFPKLWIVYPSKYNRDEDNIFKNQTASLFCINCRICRPVSFKKNTEILLSNEKHCCRLCFICTITNVGAPLFRRMRILSLKSTEVLWNLFLQVLLHDLLIHEESICFRIYPIMILVYQDYDLFYRWWWTMFSLLDLMFQVKLYIEHYIYTMRWFYNIKFHI